MATNYVTNPNFAVDTTGWNGDQGTIARVADGLFTPGTAVEVVVTNVNGGMLSAFGAEQALPHVPGDYILSFECRQASGAIDQWYAPHVEMDASHNGLGQTTFNDLVFFTPAAGVQTFVQSLTVQRPGAVGLRVLFYKVNSTGQSTVRFSNIQLIAAETGPSAQELATRRQFQLRPGY